MSWLDELKRQSAPSVHPTKPMEPAPQAERGGSVGFIGSAEAGADKLPACSGAETDGHALVAWTSDDIERFTHRAAYLQRLRGMDDAEAERLAERLTLRDRSGDDRRLCAECRHHQPGRCLNSRAAGLNSPELSSDLAALWQRCRGFDAL